MRRSQLIGQSAAIATSGGWPRQFLLERECPSGGKYDESIRSRIVLPMCLWIVGVETLGIAFTSCFPEVLVVDRDQAVLIRNEIGDPLTAEKAAVCKCQGHFLD